MRSQTVKTFFLLCYALGIHGLVYSQVLKGMITDNITNEPVANLIVYADVNNTCVTNRLGQYMLPLPTANYKPGDKIKLTTSSKEYGDYKCECVISHDYRFDFSIPKTDPYNFASGVVKDATTNASLEGIELSAQADDAKIEVPIVKSDRFGKFQMQISRFQRRDKEYIHLFIRDPNNRYSLQGGNPMIVKIGSPIEVRLRSNPNPPTHIQISGFRATSIYVQAYDRVTIEAEGNIKLGNWVGTSGPAGKEGGVLGISLEDYNIVRKFNHGALMYRFAGDTEWKLAGQRVQFIAGKSGYLEMEINDNKQNDNDGEYEVSVTIEHP